MICKEYNYFWFECIQFKIEKLCINQSLERETKRLSDDAREIIIQTRLDVLKDSCLFLQENTSNSGKDQISEKSVSGMSYNSFKSAARVPVSIHRSQYMENVGSSSTYCRSAKISVITTTNWRPPGHIFIRW